jgi:hypothetical protein
MLLRTSQQLLRCCPQTQRDRRCYSLHCRMVRLEEITTMSLVHLEFEALKILTTLEEMNSDKVATAIAAARALADALADAGGR